MSFRIKNRSSVSVLHSLVTNGTPEYIQLSDFSIHEETEACEHHEPQELVPGQWYQAAEILKQKSEEKQLELEDILDDYEAATSGEEYKSLVKRGFRDREEGDLTLWTALTLSSRYDQYLTIDPRDTNPLNNGVRRQRMFDLVRGKTSTGPFILKSEDVPDLRFRAFRPPWYVGMSGKQPSPVQEIACYLLTKEFQPEFHTVTCYMNRNR